MAKLAMVHSFLPMLIRRLPGVNVSTKGNFSALELREIVSDVEQRVMGQGNYHTIYTRSGDGGLSFGGGGTTGDRVGGMFIEIADRHERDITGWEVEDLYRSAIEGIPGVTAEIQKMENGPPVGKAIQIPGYRCRSGHHRQRDLRESGLFWKLWKVW
jgi:multidrug efflux pump